MLILALDTSTPAVTSGVVRLDGGVPEVLATKVTVDSRAHGELLTPHLLAAVAEAGATLRDLDAIVCGVGPGPFTGLRAGMVTAAALSHSLGIPAFPVCGLDAIAAEAGGPALVVTDARRREVYWARYDVDGVRVDGPAVGPPAELELGGAVRVAGQGTTVYAEQIGALGVEISGPEYPTPRGLVFAALGSLDADPAPLTPLYLRRPDATPPGERKRVSV